MAILGKYAKRARTAVKVVAAAAAVYFTAGAAAPYVAAAWGGVTASGVAAGTGAAALLMNSRRKTAGASIEQPPPAYYNAPFNPGYSYSGSPSDYLGAGGQVYGGSGAAIPIQQQSGESGKQGFTLSPVMAMAAIGIIALIAGMFILRR